MMTKSRLLLVVLFVVSARAVVAQTAHPERYKYVFTVAQDGNGDFTRIQDAIDAMRVYPLAPIKLYIKNGVYHEKIHLPETKVDVTFIGENVDSTIIVFDDYSGRGKLTTFTSYTAKISGNRFVAMNITFQNSAGRVGQAVALYVDADEAVFKNCRFLGNQDTIFASGERSRQYFQGCYVEGTTDFIFGPATAVFDHCTIHSKDNSFITAANTPRVKRFGFVFLHCTVTADPSVKKLYLGRPWRGYAKTVFIGCTLPEQIVPAGWSDWDNPDNEKTAYYAEYKNLGPGAGTSGRAPWSRQLPDSLAREYTVSEIFSDGNACNNDPRWYEVGTEKFNPEAHR
jgi:pectinesterase